MNTQLESPTKRNGPVMQFIPSKSKLILLRLACGLDSKGRGDPCRNHIVVPSDHSNSMLDTAKALVADGMLTGEIGEAGIWAGGNQAFRVTDKGIDAAKPRGIYRHVAAPLENKDEVKRSLEAVVFDCLQQAQDLLVDARACMNELVSKHKITEDDRRLLVASDKKITFAITYCGEVSYVYNGARKEKK